MESITKIRDHRIDILRGLSLIGIILVNANTMNSPPWMHTQGFAFIQSNWDAFVADNLFALFAKKTYPVFAFLFGFSASIFISHLLQNQKSIRFWYQRMLALSLFGILQVSLIWWGDILIDYALIGLLLPLFCYIPKQYLWWVTGLLFVILIIFSFIVVMTKQAGINPTDYQLYMGKLGFELISKQRIYDFYIYNFWGYQQYSTNFHYFMVYCNFHWQLLTLMVLGLTCHKMAVFNEKNRLCRVLLLILIGYGVLQSYSNPVFQQATYNIDNLLLSSAFVVVLMLLLNKKAVQNRLFPLTAVGKMSLTIYLLSSLIFSGIFYGYGLGLYGEIGPANASLIALIVIIALFVFSVIWSHFFSMGLLEYLFRKLTYLSIGKISLKPRMDINKR